MARDADDYLQAKLRKARQEAEESHERAQKNMMDASAAMEQANKVKQQAFEAMEAAEKEHVRVKRAEGQQSSAAIAAYAAVETARAAYRSAKRDTGPARHRLNRAKEMFRGSERRLNRASELEWMSRESPHQLKELRDKVEADLELAIKAGVPARFLHNFTVARKSDGEVHIYFTHKGSPSAPGHGHIIMTSSLRVRYRRDPRPA